ncbi:MAG: hypothetical protein V3V52_01420 [Candidatus Adiutricales bacterium]
MRSKFLKRLHRRILVGCVAFLFVLLVASLASASTLLIFSDPSGLSAEAIFSMTSSTSLQIILTNTSTGYPSEWDLLGFNDEDGKNANQLLTTLYFRLPGITEVIGGSAAISLGSESVNFDNISSQLGPGDNVSVEWGYGNEEHAIDSIPDDDYFPFSQVSAMQSHTEGVLEDTFAFNTASNLDGPTNLDGPQAGLTNGLILLGGLGAIQNSIIIQITLDDVISDLSFLENGTWVEFGSDAAHLPGSPVPIPSAILLLGSGILGLAGLRKKFIGRG